VNRKLATLFVMLMLAYASQAHCGPPEPKEVAPPMGMGLGGITATSATWQFADMMRYAGEWQVRAPVRTWSVVEDDAGWPLFMENVDGRTAGIVKDFALSLALHFRGISGDVVLIWEGDGETYLSDDSIKLKEDNTPGKQRRVYTIARNATGSFSLVVERSNPKNHVRNIRLWMPGLENAGATFHPEWKKCIEPFPYLRFMEWGRINGSSQKDWKDRVPKARLRQTEGVAYEYMIQLCNEMSKDAWICVPHLATDDYVLQLARLLKKQLAPGLRVYTEYSHAIGEPATRQARWLQKRAEEDIQAKGLQDARGRPLSQTLHAATLSGRRSAEIWAIMAKELGDDRLICTIAYARSSDRAMAAALDERNGGGRVDLIARSGFFIRLASPNDILRYPGGVAIGRSMDLLEQQHLLGDAMRWEAEMTGIRKQWPDIPVTSYEGGQRFTSPYGYGRHGRQQSPGIIEINDDPRMRKVYRTALETWHLSGAAGYTAFSECGDWVREGCWGHKRYLGQPLKDVVDPKTGEVKERGAHKYAALLDYMKRRSNQRPGEAPIIVTKALPDARIGKPYEVELAATGGTKPYIWSLLGGRLPTGLKVTPDGRVVGTPTKAEQLVCIVDCTDSRDQHASRILELFIDPSTGRKMEVFDFAKGLPPGWRLLGGEGIPHYPPSAAEGADGAPADSRYTVEVVLTPNKRLNLRQFVGLALNLTPDGADGDCLRVGVGGYVPKLSVLSRTARRSWGGSMLRRSCDLIRDAGESGKEQTLDVGEAWTIRATVQPGTSPGTVDILVSLFDQDGRPRLDGGRRTDVANGVLLVRDFPLKEAFRRGPFGVYADGCTIQSVRWLKHE
jgi:putative Ig domain-containing protein